MNLELYIITVTFNDAQFYHQWVEGIQHNEQYNKKYALSSVVVTEESAYIFWQN